MATPSDQYRLPFMARVTARNAITGGHDWTEVFWSEVDDDYIAPDSPRTGEASAYEANGSSVPLPSIQLLRHRADTPDGPTWEFRADGSIARCTSATRSGGLYPGVLVEDTGLLWIDVSGPIGLKSLDGAALELNRRYPVRRAAYDRGGLTVWHATVTCCVIVPDDPPECCPGCFTVELSGIGGSIGAPPPFQGDATPFNGCWALARVLDPDYVNDYVGVPQGGCLWAAELVVTDEEKLPPGDQIFRVMLVVLADDTVFFIIWYKDVEMGLIWLEWSGVGPLGFTCEGGGQFGGGGGSTGYYWDADAEEWVVSTGVQRPDLPSPWPVEMVPDPECSGCGSDSGSSGGGDCEECEEPLYCFEETGGNTYPMDLDGPGEWAGFVNGTPMASYFAVMTFTAVEGGCTADIAVLGSGGEGVNSAHYFSDAAVCGGDFTAYLQPGSAGVTFGGDSWRAEINIVAGACP